MLLSWRVGVLSTKHRSEIGKRYLARVDNWNTTHANCQIYRAPFFVYCSIARAAAFDNGKNIWKWICLLSHLTVTLIDCLYLIVWLPVQWPPLLRRFKCKDVTQMLTSFEFWLQCSSKRNENAALCRTYTTLKYQI